LHPDEGELAFMAEWAGKLHGNMTRLAGLIHCINAFEQGRNPLETQIYADEAKAAVELARYFLSHAIAVFSEQAEPRHIANAKYLWKKIISINSLQFSKSILTRKTQGKQGLDLDESLQLLIHRGYIRLENAQTGTAGRPAETIIVNPETQSIVNKLNLVNQSTQHDNSFNLFYKFTIPAKVPNVPMTTGFTLEPNDDADDNPFTAVHAS
jgi:hypothetical protein